MRWLARKDSRQAGGYALGRMARQVRVHGRDNVPMNGPLLLVSNHPGLADAVAVFAPAAAR